MGSHLIKQLPRLHYLQQLTLCLVSAALLCLTGCEQRPEVTASQTQSAANVLTVLTHNDATTYFVDASGHYAGLEYDLVNLFAEEMGMQVHWKVVDHVSQALPLLEKGEASFAAMGLSTGIPGNGRLKFGPAYQQVMPVFVYRTGTNPIKKLDDLSGRKIIVEAGSGIAARLSALSKQNQNINWQAVTDRSAEDLLEEVATGTVDVTVASEYMASSMKRFHPELEVGPVLGPAESIAWAFPPGTDPEVIAKTSYFFKRIGQNGTLKRLLDRYYGHLDRLQPVDVEAFLKQRLELLPRYRAWFHEAQKLTGVDWRLLAAVGYQESHWNPLAVSPAGVRGLMMLTEETANRMGVLNRTDPRQNIIAGARYIRQILEDLPVQIGEPDRNWMALAAYNTGLGHLEDARVLASKQKLDPNAWTDMKGTLLQLRNPAWFTKTKHGYARGGETVIFVENIRTYYDILSRLETPLVEGLPGLSPGEHGASAPSLTPGATGIRLPNAT
ncbi:membrane-bound lytic murein transglycosylase MltF [Leeia oryzae]|uniref:membrane-bound lytic murein transglycosylase MltF n=1 Tax=Leeia oryzae TaxID=356662 RepID=UPI0003A92EA5|nr:membrane-bound lytic murein transglycosylase MltF [Leeia oryzae]